MKKKKNASETKEQKEEEDEDESVRQKGRLIGRKTEGERRIGWDREMKLKTMKMKHIGNRMWYQK